MKNNERNMITLGIRISKKNVSAYYMRSVNMGMIQSSGGKSHCFRKALL